jgi:GntR family transcriptional regulator / MocR family aminotransferase
MADPVVVLVTCHDLGRYLGLYGRKTVPSPRLDALGASGVAGYPPLRLLMQSLGMRVSPVRVDPQGIVVKALPADAKLVYVSPAHQFPLGMRRDCTSPRSCPKGQRLIV